MSSYNGPGNHQHPSSGDTPTSDTPRKAEGIADHHVDVAPAASNFFSTSSATTQVEDLMRGQPQYSGHNNSPQLHHGPADPWYYPQLATMQPNQFQQQFNQVPNFGPNASIPAGLPMPPGPPFTDFGRAPVNAVHQPAESAPVMRKAEMLIFEAQNAQVVREMKASRFWDQVNYFLPAYDDKVVQGTASRLWGITLNMDMAIVDKYKQYQLLMGAVPTPPYSSPQYGVQRLIEDDAGDDSDSATESDETPTKKRKISPKAKGKATQKNTPKKKSSQKPRKRAEKYPDPPCATYDTVAAYATDQDLATEADCLKFLAYPTETQAIDTIAHDDWQDVRDNHLEESIGKIFNVLLHPQEPDPASYSFTPSKIDMKKYNAAQTKAMKACGEKLGTPDEVKRAKAHCKLLVLRVIYFHENGPAKAKWDGFQWHKVRERVVERKYRLDLETICSDRLDKIVEIIRDNKRVAIDVLEGENFDRIAEHPSQYLQTKFSMAESNNKRQDKVDEVNQMTLTMRSKATKNGQKQAKTTAGRSKQKAKALIDDILEDDVSDSSLDALDYVKGPRASRSRKKVQRYVEDLVDNDDDDFAEEVSEEDFEEHVGAESDEEYEPPT